MITITYFLLLFPGEYNGPKSESTPFRLKYISFVCVFHFFAFTAIEANLQTATFFILTFTSQNNGVRGRNYQPQILYGPPPMYQGLIPPVHTLFAWERLKPSLPPISRNGIDRDVKEHHPNHDIQDPQYCLQLLWPSPGIWSQLWLLPIPPFFRRHDAPLRRTRHQHHQADRLQTYLLDDTLPTGKGWTCHEELIIPHYHAWHILLHDPQRRAMFQNFCLLPTHSVASSFRLFGTQSMVTLGILKVAYLPPIGGPILGHY